MKFWKKATAVLAAVLSLVLIFSACAKHASSKDESKEATTAQPQQQSLQIVTTIFPTYDWIRQILGDQASADQLTMLLDNGVDLHSYQPSTDDMLKIANCDLFVYVGGESDGWVDDALKSAKNPNRQVINLLDVLGDRVQEEETVEGMEAEEEEEGAEEEEGPEYDEHVWLSLKNAKSLCAAITDALCKLDAANADTYKANLQTYTEKLTTLDNNYQQTVDNAKRKTVLFGDRFPFRYLVDDYHLTYYAAFVGCSAETEASFKTIRFLANKVDQLNLPVVLTIENPKHRIAQTVVENTKKKNQKILAMNSMQSVTKQDMEKGVTYLSIMEQNLTTLKTALN